MKPAALLPLGVFLVLTGFFAFGLTKDPTQIKTQMTNRPVPNFTLSSLEDALVVHTQDDLRGRVSLVNVFGSWCAPCAIEHPNIVEIGKQDVVRLVGVNWRDDRAAGQDWLERLGDPYDIVLFDDLSLLAIGMGVTGAPESYIVDKSGVVRYKHVGIVTPQIWRDTLLPIVNDLKKSPI